ncbi:xanthine dehydrogenase family protein molybdopterin-binding subunit [Sneathiella sp. CAU 1612]|uniref:Xanthine dehydrogenase family protein molybdopterin-binding subunit n=1 Tax=Sneathiella sedimenti TaxID=2816034 RepID=A0ABS3F5H2_9PROT|nr:molybdopterin cofactor-binding domain-containing protein [Sneathiella sedimenti]MBO0333779.1 xanthine dehydrogenase family protein molybdopterin-binding subunit [Sneathiella sedimenti]
MTKLNLTRRKFIVGGALVGGGLAVGYGFLRDGDPANAALTATTMEGEVALNAWVKVDKDGLVTVAIPRSEMGQGVYTALAMLVAEEMDANFSELVVEQAPVADVYANIAVMKDALPFSDKHHEGEDTIGAWGMAKLGQFLGVQVTGGSSSVRDAWLPMRQAGATAKAMLVAAAARTWDVPPAEISVTNGVLSHGGSGMSGGFGDFAILAASETVSLDPVLKKSSEFTLIGTPQPRLDIPSKVDGTAEFGVDIELDGMVHAAVKLSPVLGGTLASHDASAVKDMPGVLKVVPFESGVAVIADSFWRAKTAVEALPATFNDGPAKEFSSGGILTLLEENLESEDSRIYAETGDARAAIDEAQSAVKAVYKVPFLAHACMEPMNCTAMVTDTGVEIWMPNQVPTLIKWFAEKIADVPAENVIVHTPLLGGGFGRRLEIDLVIMAVAIAKEMKNRPVKLLWTRENDIQHDIFRPAAVSRLEGTLGSDGRISAWANRIVSQSVSGSYTARLLPWATMDVPDNTTSEGAADIPYEFTSRLVDHVPVKLPIEVGFWRSVGHSYNAFFTESFMDEMAYAARADPVDFRLAHLENHPDFANVLKQLAKVSNWSTPLDQGRARGVALHESFSSIVGQVVEITVNGDKEITVDKVYCVIDCGAVVNPDTVKAQMESGIVFGLTAALYGEIEIEDGVVLNSNFPDYEMIRLANCPEIEVHLAPSGRLLGGVGEPGTPPIAAALANAIFAGTGERLRELPISRAGFIA